MSDLISTPPSPASPPDSMVAADGWFPAIDCNALRDRLRLGDSGVPHKRLVGAIEGAMIHAFRQLAAWRTLHAAGGVAALADVPDDGIQINDQTRAEIIWERIIRYYAAAELADGHRDIVAADQQSQRSDEKRLSADDYRRIGHNAVADLMSIGVDTPVARNSVELL